MSEFDRLSPRAQHALRVSCAQSNVPMQLDDPATMERITALLRTTATAAPARSRAADQPQIEPVPLKNRRRRQHGPEGEPCPETTAAPESTVQQSTRRPCGNSFPESAAQPTVRVGQSTELRSQQRREEAVPAGTETASEQRPARPGFIRLPPLTGDGRVPA
jgi:hypothetical protein